MSKGVGTTGRLTGKIDWETEGVIQAPSDVSRNHLIGLVVLDHLLEELLAAVLQSTEIEIKPIES
jgi:hypothetical protein